MQYPIKFKLPEVPPDLSETSKSLFRLYQSSLDTPAKVQLFIAGLRALDTGNKAAKILSTDGLMASSDRSGLDRAHACFRIQKESIAEFHKIFKTLDLGRNNILPPGEISYQDHFQIEND